MANRNQDLFVHVGAATAAEARRRGQDPQELERCTRGILHYIYTSLPDTPVNAAAFLSARPGPDPSGEDRLSALPFAILRNIVSRLPTKDAVRTAALSRRWRPVWRCTPLAFADAHLVEGHLGGHREPVRAYTPGLVSTISRVLAAHPGLFRAVHIVCCYMGAHQPQLARWIPEARGQGRPGAGPHQPPLAARCAPPRGAPPRLHAHQTLPRLLEVPGHVRPPARCRHGVPQPPRARPQLHGHRESRHGLPPQREPHPGETGHTGIQEQGDAPQPRRPSPPVCADLHVHCSEHCSYEHPKPGAALHMGIHGGQRLLRQGQDWQFPKAALTWILGAWNSHAGDPQHRHQCTYQYHLSDHFICYKFHFDSTCKWLICQCAIFLLFRELHEFLAGISPSPSSMAPNVKILGLDVRFGVRNDVKMLPTFLRCFPNVQTLHVMSHKTETAGKLNLKFWQEVDPIESIQSCIKMMTFRGFSGERSEAAFLKFIFQNAVIVASKGCFTSIRDATSKVQTLKPDNWGNDCSVLVCESLGPDGGELWSFRAGFEFSVGDPFCILLKS